MDYTILVNKENPLDKKFVPNNLMLYTEYNGEKIDPNHKTLVEKETLKAFLKLKRAAQEEGKSISYPMGFDFVVDSGYRSYEYQEKVFKYNLEQEGVRAYSYVALPGCSEHQTGLAIDVALNTNGIYNDKFDDSFLEIKWLHENCHRFGFILRYPKTMEDITGFNYECWHLRYVGRELSLYMKENNILTLEEYYSQNLTK